MSEYQRYEFMTSDRPLTSAQLAEVKNLSSHIETSSTQATIEYNWGDFKHDPIMVLHKYFDGFLYWANWGSPHFALRFPHGTLPANLIDSYDFDDFVTFTKHADYDILDIHFGEMEAPDEWIEYELAPLMAIRDELMEGDQRPLYIAWLAVQQMIAYEGEEEEEEEDFEEYEEGEDEEEEEDGKKEDAEDEKDDEDGEKEGAENVAQMVPPGLGTLTIAQEALVELLRVPQELVGAASQHSNATAAARADNFRAWVMLLPQDLRSDYLVRLANNEPGLSRKLVKELRELGLGKVKETPVTGEYVTYATLLTESRVVRARLARELFEREQQARHLRLQNVYDNREEYWRQATTAVVRGVSSGYDEAANLLSDLRDAAAEFNEAEAFEERFQAWIPAQMRRPAFLRRMQERKFTLPQV